MFNNERRVGNGLASWETEDSQEIVIGEEGKTLTSMVVTNPPPEKMYWLKTVCDFKGYLEDDQGNRLEGKIVKFWNLTTDSVWFTDETDSEGRWRFKWQLCGDPVTWGPITNDFQAKFPGDESYESSETPVYPIKLIWQY